MSPTFSHVFLLVLYTISVFSTATTTHQSSRGLKLIHSFNLHPKHDANIVKSCDTSATKTAKKPRLVEKRFKLPVLGDSKATTQDLGHHAGYFRLPDTVDARMFYFFFESRSSTADPVVIWLTGGPGCSSELALFYENGPFHIAKNLSLVWNDFGWDKVSNLIYVDQPTGTGFSYSSSEDDLRHDEKGVSNDLYNFLQEFFKAHPQYLNNDFYITGESYAGHYIPAFAARVNQGNKNKEGFHINLKGFAIGNGLTDPSIQYGAYPDYSLEHNLITKSDFDSISKLVPECQLAARQCGTQGNETCLSALNTCGNIFSNILQIAGNINYYDIRKQCVGSLCYDFSAIETYLNLESTRKALGVGKIDFVSCSNSVYQAMQVDWMRNLEVGIPSLLEDGINVLVYAGEYDLICNWLGNSRWVNAMKWSGQEDFLAAPAAPFLVDSKEAGLLNAHGHLNFLKVYNAGHLVPMDQPKAALQMLERWIHGKLAVTRT